MKGILFSGLFFFTINLSLFSQGFERLLPMPSTSTSLANNSYDFDPILGGIITANNSQSPSDTVKMYAFDSIGNIRWVKSFRPMPEGLDISKFSSAILDNGNYIICGPAISNGTGTFMGYTQIVRELDNNGNTFNTRLLPIEVAWDNENIEVYPLRNGSSEYYLTSRSDSMNYSTTPIQVHSKLTFEKASSGGITIWTKSHTCIDTMFADPTIIYGSAVTKEGGLVACFKAPCLMSGSLVVLEKFDENGNTLFIKDLQPIINSTIGDFSINSVLSCKDSSIVVIASKNNGVFPSFLSYLLRFDQSGNLIDSVTNSSALFHSAFEKANGDILVNYYNYTPTGTFSVSGMIRYDYGLNYLNTYPLPFLENFYSRIKMIPNNIGGAFFGFTRYSLTTTSKHLRIVNVDSVLNSYPAKINGSVNMDLNTNCFEDATDYRLKDRMIVATDTLTNIPYYAFTSTSGNYIAAVPSGQFDVTQIPQGNAGIECPLTYSLYLNDTSNVSGINFNDTLPGTMNDLKSTIYCDPIVPGFESTLSVIYRNDGAITQNAELKIIIDTALNYVSSSLTPTTISGDTLFFPLVAFSPDSANVIDIVVYADSTLVLGTSYKFISSLNNTTIDFAPSNNNDTLSGLVIGSFDPNDKSVNQPHYIYGNEELTYKIRFQNTGTYYARKVVLVDSLSQYLDYSSLKFIDASAAYTAQLRTDGTLIISFDDIFLPDSNTNEIGSHGYFVYSIKPKSTLALGQKIKNRAKIYFDYNSPIITNTTFNEKGNPLLSITEKWDDYSLLLYPNPASEYVTLNFGKVAKASVIINDVLGKSVLKTFLFGSTLTIPISSLESGIYFLKIEEENGRKEIVKFIIAR